VKPEDPEDEPDDPVIKPEPTDDDTPMEDGPEVIVPVPMPNIKDRSLRQYQRNLGVVNKNMYYNIDGSVMKGGNEFLPAQLFVGICPDRYSVGYASQAAAARVAGGSGIYGYPSFTTATSGSAVRERWWSTNFDTGFTFESKEGEPVGEYISKTVAMNGSTRTLMGVCCQLNQGALVSDDYDFVYIKWGTAVGQTAPTPMMQFTVTNEDGSQSVLNYTINVPYANGEVDVNELERRIMTMAPANGCFFTMDLRVGLVYLHMMDGAPQPGKVVPRDDPWVQNTEPKDMRSDPEVEEDDEEDEEDEEEEEEEQARVAAQVKAAVDAALAAAAITQAQAVAAQKAADDADKAQALAAQSQLLTAQMNAAVASAIAAGQLSQDQAVAAQKAADDYQHDADLAYQSQIDAAQMSQAVANAVAAQANKDANQQQAAVAAQAAADASAQQVAVAKAVSDQAAADAAVLSAALAKAYLGLPQASKLSALPTLKSGVKVTPTSTDGRSENALTPYTMDYSHVWVKAFSGFDQSMSSGQTDNTTLAANQVSPVTTIVYGGDSKYHGFSIVNAFAVGSDSLAWYSGWLRQGTATQMCGWILYTTGGVYLVCTAYGYTSQSPRASVQPQGAMYTLTTPNIQGEILTKMSSKNMGTVNYSGASGFIYDAAVGDYGQVTWISQI
jgi:hypothetical protein